MIVISRAECRLRPATKRVPFAPPSQGIGVHCSDGCDPKTEREALAAWRATQVWHQRGCGWRDIAYAFAFNNLGMVMEGRGWELVCGAAKGFNRIYRHVMWQGTPGRGHVPNDRAFAALADIIAEHDRRFGAGAVFGHRDVHPHKPCPGDALYEHLIERYGERNPFREARP